MESGTYALSNGDTVVIADSQTPLDPARPPRGQKCQYSKLEATTCRCWHCQGLKQPRWTPPKPEKKP